MLTFCLPVSLRGSHLSGSVFCVYKRELGCPRPVACEKGARHGDLLPAPVDLSLGTQPDPGGGGGSSSRTAREAGSLARFVLYVVIHVHIGIKERVSGEIRVWGSGKTVLCALVLEGLCP